MGVEVPAGRVLSIDGTCTGVSGVRVDSGVWVLQLWTGSA